MSERPLPPPAETQLREDFHFQEHDPFENFLAHIDQHEERRPPTEEEKTSMNLRLKTLGEIFEGAPSTWILDGALNISLRSGKYIGIHKDVDVSIPAENLEQLEAHLAGRGYGFFLSYPKDPSQPNGKRIMERVDAATFRAAAETDQNERHPMLAAIDANGKIRSDAPLNNVDVHLLLKSGAENRPTWGNTNLPPSWSEPSPMAFQGTTINLSHPARVAFFKLLSDRAYDLTDLRHLAATGALTPQDIEDFREIYRQEEEVRIAQARVVLAPILAAIPAYANQEAIYQLFQSDPTFGPKIRGRESFFQSLALQLAQTSDRSFENVFEIVRRTFEKDKRDRQLEAKIAQLAAWIQEFSSAPKSR